MSLCIFDSCFVFWLDFEGSLWGSQSQIEILIQIDFQFNITSPESELCSAGPFDFFSGVFSMSKVPPAKKFVFFIRWLISFDSESFFEFSKTLPLRFLSWNQDFDFWAKKLLTRDRELTDYDWLPTSTVLLPTKPDKFSWDFWNEFLSSTQHKLSIVTPVPPAEHDYLFLTQPLENRKNKTKIQNFPLFKTFQIRRGVMEILTSMEGEENTNFDMEVTTTELVWRGIMAKDKSPAMAVLRKQLEIKPRVQKLQNFISYFDIDT